MRESAEQAISLLLANRENNPFLALGLSAQSSEQEITGRWKRLISLFHPDRTPGSPDEETAKLINQAYTRARAPEARRAFRPNANKGPESGKTVHKSYSRLKKNPIKFEYLRYASLAVLVLAVCAALLTTAVFVVQKMKAGDNTGPREIKKEPEVAASLPKISVPDKVPAKREKSEKAPDKKNETPGKDKTRALRKNAPGRGQAKNTPTGERRVLPPKRAEMAATEDVDFNEMRPEAAAAMEEKPFKREARVSPEIILPLPYRPELDFKEGNIVDEINALIRAFLYYNQRGELEGYLSLFAEDAIENGKEVSSLTDEYRMRYGRFDESMTMRKLMIRIRDKDRAEVSADYLAQRFEREENRNLVHEGKMRLRIERSDKGLFKILRYDYD